jgi:chromate reductase, NAD(P)H dehydrogenase (quinone)
MQITVISGTNRPGNLSIKVADICKEILEEQDVFAELIDLQQLPREIAFDYLGDRALAGFAEFQQMVDRSSHFVFVVPEYNGSMPGILKLFIDACDYPDSFRGKSAVCVGIAAGLGGNQRGLAHLRDVLEYFGMVVHTEKLALGSIRQRLHAEGGFSDADSELDLRNLLQGYLEASRT